MAKTQRKHRNSEGKLKKVYRPFSTQKEKKHESQKFSAYSNRKAEEQQSKDMMARQAELDAMGMPVEQQEFGFEDHKALYNYAQERAPFNQPPIKIIDPSAVLKVELSQSKKETVLKQSKKRFSMPPDLGMSRVLAGPRRFFIRVNRTAHDCQVC